MFVGSVCLIGHIGLIGLISLIRSTAGIGAFVKVCNEIIYFFQTILVCLFASYLLIFLTSNLLSPRALSLDPYSLIPGHCLPC